MTLSPVPNIKVMLDSKTFDGLIKTGDRLALAILAQQNSGPITFTRTPLDNVSELLGNIPPFRMLANGSSFSTIELPSLSVPFSVRSEDVKALAKMVYGHDSNQQELDDVVAILVLGTLYDKNESEVFVTNNKAILEKRSILLPRFQGAPPYVVTVIEAGLYLDYFRKKNDDYFVNPAIGLKGAWYWYWLSMRTKLPHYNVGDPMLDAMGDRFQFAFMALDQIARQYYAGPDNDTLEWTLYHFNHLIAIITGIFDNLALKTNEYLKINFTNLSKVSLSNEAGGEFLKEIRTRDSMLRGHISDYMNLIMLAYSFREAVLHREGLDKTSFEYKGPDAKWRANMIPLDQIQLRRLKECIRWGTESQWGLFAKWCEPFQFSQTYLTTLGKFADRYLELLGEKPYMALIKTEGEREGFVKDLLDFEKYRLGF